MCGNSVSAVACIHTCQLWKSTNQDTMVVWELGGELITVVSCFMVIYWQKVLLISIPFSFAHHGWLFVESPLSFTHLVASA
jgi:hypothetical protein